MQKKMIGFGIGVIVFVFVCAGIFFVSEAGSADYYTQINNSKVRQVEERGGVIDFNGGLSYSYTLLTYNASGQAKEITFGASRELKEGAFIRLTVMPIRGVLRWEEVDYDALPAAVQNQYVLMQ